MDKKDLAEKIRELREIDNYFDNAFAAGIDKIEEILCDSEYKVVVVGEFSTGKSTFINALVGKKLLYSAAIEATGAVTALRSGEKAFAEAYDEAGQLVESFSIDSQEGIWKLNSHLQIGNEHSTDRVDITYPLGQVERDIVFLDTPGIEKMSKKQLELTKHAIDDANAVIFLVKKDGFAESSLKVLAGEDEDIGKIQAKDIFVVMTRIGEVYRDRTEEEAIEKIKELKREILSQLSGIGLSGLIVFALDSRDYLWGRDDELYREVKRQSTEEDILSQEEYIKRSNFEEFRQSLLLFLDRDERAKNVLNDVRSRMNRLANDMLESVEDKSDEQNNLENKLNRINYNIQLACQNRSKFYKQLRRLLSNYLLEFEDSVVKDVDAQRDKREQFAQMIEREIPRSIQELRQEDAKKCLDQVKHDNLRFSRELEENINKQKEIFARQYVEKVFAEEFNRFFDEIGSVEGGISLSEYADIKIDVKQGRKLYDVDKEDFLEEIKQEIQEERDKIQKYRERVEWLRSIERVEEREGKLRQELTDKEREQKRELAKLGERPKAKQKYKKEKKTKGYLFWKKTYILKVPDGLDYSECKEWDDKYEKLDAYYENRMESIRQNLKIAKGQVRELNLFREKLEKAKTELAEKERQKRGLEEKLEKRKRENREQFIERKKEEIFVACTTLNDNMLQAIKKSVQEYLYKLRTGVINDIDKKSEQFVSEYKKKLLEESEKVGSSIHLLGIEQNRLAERIMNIIAEE